MHFLYLTYSNSICLSPLQCPLPHLFLSPHYLLLLTCPCSVWVLLTPVLVLCSSHLSLFYVLHKEAGFAGWEEVGRPIVQFLVFANTVKNIPEYKCMRITVWFSNQHALKY